MWLSATEHFERYVCIKLHRGWPEVSAAKWASRIPWQPLLQAMLVESMRAITWQDTQELSISVLGQAYRTAVLLCAHIGGQQVAQATSRSSLTSSGAGLLMPAEANLLEARHLRISSNAKTWNWSQQLLQQGHLSLKLPSLYSCLRLGCRACDPPFRPWQRRTSLSTSITVGSHRGSCCLPSGLPPSHGKWGGWADIPPRATWV
mmetsp:Transcript_41193/g.74451  ORF Transcript_41193/g.74451 Transcript_41193/m.74451 type:complete len:204 (+) Transcript_41193:77-688(+)